MGRNAQCALDERKHASPRLAHACPRISLPARPYPLVVNVHGGPSLGLHVPLGCGSHWSRSRRWATSRSAPTRAAVTDKARPSREATSRISAAATIATSWPASMPLSKQYPIDPKRLGIRGHSYGGYMTMWAETQTAALCRGGGGRRPLRLAQLLRLERHRRMDDPVLRRFGLRRPGRVREERSRCTS